MSDQDGPLFLVVEIKPRLDRLEEAEAQLQSMRRNTLSEPGCVFMHLVQPQDDPDTWVMLEMFSSRAAWDEHMTASPRGQCLLQDLLREPSRCAVREVRCRAAAYHVMGVGNGFGGRFGPAHEGAETEGVARWLTPQPREAERGKHVCLPG